MEERDEKHPIHSLMMSSAAAYSGTTLPGVPNQGAVSPEMPLPWSSVSHAEDRKKIYEFFQFSCVYSMSADESLTQWGNGLPKGYSFEQIPVITNDGERYAALAYYAVQAMEPEKLDVFKAALFKAMSIVGADNVTPEAVLVIAKQSGVDVEYLLKATKTNSVQKKFYRALELQRKYAITDTPSVAIAGKYVTHAGMTNGNYETLVRLITGLLSKEVKGFE